jgi:hypothetical protein
MAAQWLTVAFNLVDDNPLNDHRPKGNYEDIFESRHVLRVRQPFAPRLRDSGLPPASLRLAGPQVRLCALEYIQAGKGQRANWRAPRVNYRSGTQYYGLDHATAFAKERAIARPRRSGHLGPTVECAGHARMVFVRFIYQPPRRGRVDVEVVSFRPGPAARPAGRKR